MSFDERYQLLNLAEDENARTFTALEISTGKKVTVFLFEGEQARKHASLLSKLQGLDRRLFPELIETGNNQGTPYVVTQSISCFSELTDRVSNLKAAPPAPSIDERRDFGKVGLWRVPAELQSKPDPKGNSSEDAAFAANRKQPQTRAPAAPSNTPGEFTQMFQAAAAPIGEFETDARVSSPASAAPGEFTQMFQSVPAPIGDSTSNDSKAILKQPAASPKASPEPGEFTRFFNAVTPSSAVPIPVPSKPESIGDFNRHFGTGSGASAQSPSITSMFDQPSLAALEKEQSKSSSVSTPPNAYTPPAGEFTRIFGGSSTDSPAPIPDAIPPSAAPTPAPPAAQGEYTRMFSAPSASPEVHGEVVSVPSPASPTPAKQPSKLVPVLIGVILLLLAAIAVIVIATGK